jgi:integrase
MPKKRSPGDGALYSIRGGKLWRGVVDVGFNPDGSRKQAYVHGRTQAKARAKLDALKDEIKQHGAPLDKATTVAVWAEKWLTTVCQPKLKPAPMRSYESVVRNWIVPTIGKKKLALLKPSDLRTVTAAITDAGRSSSTALKAHNIMSAMLESARRDGLIARNITADVDAPAAAPSTRGAFPIDSALRILAAASMKPDGTRWWTALLAGVRQGERLGATLDSIDFAKNEFAVQWSLTEARFRHGCEGTCGKGRPGSCPQRKLVLRPGLEHRPLDGRLILVRPKSGRPRTFPMIPQLAEALRRYLAATADVPNPHGLIWPNLDGSPMTAKQENQAWRDLLLDAGLIDMVQALPPKDRPEGTPDVPTTHWNRHTTATVLTELDVPATVIAEIVGHVDVRTTARYTHVTTPMARAALEKLGQHWAGALESSNPKLDPPTQGGAP